jgi:hypothetical protein
MIKSTLILGIISVFLLVGCTTDSTNSTLAEKPKNDENHSHNSVEEINLDGKNKWKVVNEMLVYIRNMEHDVSTFEQRNGDDFNQLGEKLDSSITLLTSNCTMTGKAHDELHKWLVPFIEMADELKNASSTLEAEKSYKEIQASFKLFNRYFK